MADPLPIITEARARELLETARMRRHSQLSKMVPVDAHELEALCDHFSGTKSEVEIRSAEREAVLSTILRVFFPSWKWGRVREAVAADAEERSKIAAPRSSPN